MVGGVVRVANTNYRSEKKSGFWYQPEAAG
jgi:hypothetical protein